MGWNFLPGMCDSREGWAASPHPSSSLMCSLKISFTMPGAWGLDGETEASRKLRDGYVDLGTAAI